MGQSCLVFRDGVAGWVAERHYMNTRSAWTDVDSHDVEFSADWGCNACFGFCHPRPTLSTLLRLFLCPSVGCADTFCLEQPFELLFMMNVDVEAEEACGLCVLVGTKLAVELALPADAWEQPFIDFGIGTMTADDFAIEAHIHVFQQGEEQLLSQLFWLIVLHSRNVVARTEWFFFHFEF